MFQNWYVAYVNQLSLEDTTAFLASLDILENTELSNEVRRNAILGINDHFDLNLQVYALPVLVKVVLSDQLVSEEALQLVRKICAQTGNKTAVKYADSLCKKSELKTLLKDFDATIPERDIFDENDYLELVERADIIMPFSVMTCLTNDELEIILEANPVWSSLIEESVKGTYGRFILTLAAKIITLHEIDITSVPAHTLLRFDNQFAYLPDLLYSWLLLKTRNLSALDLFEMKMPEKLDNCISYNGKVSDDIREISSWLFRGRDKQQNDTEIKKSAGVIWEYSKLLLCIRRAIEEKSLTNLLNKMLSDWKKNRDNGSFSRTPWMFRHSVKIDKRNYTDDPEYARMIKYQTETMKSAMVVPILSLVLSRLKQDELESLDVNNQDFLFNLLMNLSDAYSGSVVRKSALQGCWSNDTGSIKEWYFSTSVCQLMSYAHEVLDHICKGYYLETVPNKFVELVEKYALPIFEGQNCSLNEQDRFLHSEASINLCAYFAYEGASGDIPISDQKYGWMEVQTGDHSLAERVCSISLNEYGKYIDREYPYDSSEKSQACLTMSKPVSLANEHFRQCIPSDMSHFHIQDWLNDSDYLSDTSYIYNVVEICLKEYGLQDWRHGSIKLPRRTLDGGRETKFYYSLFVLAKKLSITLSEAATLENNELDELQTFAQTISGFFKKEEFPRYMRFASIEVLRALLDTDAFMSVATNSQQNMSADDAQDICQSIISVITDLSRDAVFYQYKLAEVLLKSNMAQKSTLNHLRTVFFSLLLNQEKTEEQLENKALSPFELLEKQRSAIGRKRLLLWYIDQLRTQMATDVLLRTSFERVLDNTRIESFEQIPVKFSTEEIVSESRGVICCLDDWNKNWDPDTYGCSQRGGQPLCSDVFVTEENGRLNPIERDYVDFLVEQSFEREESNRYVLIDKQDNSILVSAKPGYNYRLPFENWESESLKQLILEIDENSQMYDSSPYGMYFNLRVVERNGIPYICLENAEYVNLKYRGLFQSDDRIDESEIVDSQIISNGFSVRVSYRPSKLYYVVPDDGWAISARRKGEVNLIPDQEWQRIDNVPESENLHFVQDILTWKRGKIITLSKIFPCSKKDDRPSPSLSALANGGVKLWVESDSVAMDHYKVVAPLPDVKAVLTKVPPLKKGVEPNGIVWGINLHTGVAEIKYIEKDQLKELRVNISELGISEPRSLYPGLFVRVEDRFVCVAQYTNNYKVKRLTARRLWDVELRNGNVTINENKQAYLGEAYFQNDSQPTYLIQDYKIGKLFAYSSADEAPDILCGVNLSKCLVSEIFRKADTALVECRQGNKTFFGESKPGVFTKTGVRCTKVSVILDGYEKGTKILYDVHRVFSEPVHDYLNSASSIDQDSKQAPIRQKARDWYEAFLNWKNPDMSVAVEGEIKTLNGEPIFRLTGPITHIPMDIDNISDQDDSMWTMEIPLAPSVTQVSWAFDRSASVYAVLKWTADGPVADPDNTPPYNLKTFSKWMNRKFPNRCDYCENPLVFIEREETQNGSYLVFEWGWGYKLRIKKDAEFLCDNAIGVADVLFFGDQIEKYSIVRQNKTLVLKISSRNVIVPSTNHDIYEQSCKGKKVPLVKVVYDVETDSISTLEITLSKNWKNELDTKAHAWDFVPYREGLLDEAAKNAIRKKLPQGGEGYILAKPQWDPSNKRMTYSLSELERNNIIPVWGETILKFKTGNDYYLSCKLPNGSRLLNVDEVKIQISRRNFSYRESTLRSLYERGVVEAYNNVPLLVKVVRIQDKILSASLKELPSRDSAVIHELIRREGDQRVIIGKRLNGQKRRCVVELRPGVFCESEMLGQTVEGYSGVLSSKGTTLTVHAISDSENDFLMTGRIVELLLKSEKALNDQNANHFTAAGFPQTQFSNKSLGDQIIKQNLPRFGKIASSNKLDDNEVQGVAYGYVKVKENKIVVTGNCNSQLQTIPDYSKISFYDADVSTLIKHISRGTWHYHDKSTVVKPIEGQGKIVNYREGQNLPILFNEESSLRYNQKELMRFAYLPYELEEYGIPSDQKGLDGYYPIAGCTEDSIFVELLPGRVVRLPIKLLKIRFMFDAERHLKTNCFSVGDLVKLETRSDKLNPGKPHEIAIMDIKYGMRAYIEKSAVLKAKFTENDGAILGEGSFILKYPTAQIGKNGTYRLTKKNDLHMMGEDDFPKKGEVVLVRLDDNQDLRVDGFDQVEVLLGNNKEDTWTKMMLNTKKEFFGAVGCLPMVVSHADPARRMIQVDYPDQPEIKNGQLVCAQVVGRIDNYLILRAGIRLILMDIAIALGIETEEASAILDEVWGKQIKRSKTFWLNCVSKVSNLQFQFAFGLKQVSKDDNILVSVIATVDRDDYHGVLCMANESRELLWLPVDNIVRAKGVTACQALEALKSIYGITDSTSKNRMNISVKKVRKGVVSWIKANPIMQKQYANLSPTDRERFVKIRVVCKLEESKYLCYERPRGNIYMLCTELPQACSGPEAAIDAICVQKDETNAVLIPSGQVRENLHLSRYYIEALHRSFVEERKRIDRDKMKREYYDVSKQIQLIADRHLNFMKLDENAVDYCMTDVFDLLRDGYASGDSVFEEEKEQVKDLLNEWKNAYEQRRHNSKTSLPVTDAIFLAVLAWCIDREIGASMFKFLCEEARWYCCEEILLNKWVLMARPYSKYNLRGILEGLMIWGRKINANQGQREPNDRTKDGTLTTKQYNEIILGTEAMLRRNSFDANEDISLLAQSMQYVVDCKERSVLKNAWKSCYYHRIKEFNEMDSFLKDIVGLEKWIETLRSCGLYFICVQDLEKFVGYINEIRIGDNDD